jgi:hypothetical protein
MIGNKYFAVRIDTIPRSIKLTTNNILRLENNCSADSCPSFLIAEMNAGIRAAAQPPVTRLTI